MKIIKYYGISSGISSGISWVVWSFNKTLYIYQPNVINLTTSIESKSPSSVSKFFLSSVSNNLYYIKKSLIQCNCSDDNLSVSIESAKFLRKGTN